MLHNINTVPLGVDGPFYDRGVHLITTSKTVDKMCSCIADIYLWADFHIGNVVQFCSKISEITVSLGAFLVFYGSGSMTKSIL